MAETSGLFESLKRLTGTLVAIAHTRLELLSNDIEEARARVSRMLVYGCLALFCFGMAAVLLTAFIVACFWDTHRLLAAGGMFAFYILAGLLALNALRRLAKPRIFSGSLAELAKDRDGLASRHD